MRYILGGLLVFCLFTNVYADRVCIEKSTGKILDYQSGDDPLGILTANVTGWGYKKEDIEEKYITPQEWQALKEEQIDKPAKEKAEKEKQNNKKIQDATENKLKTLGFTDEEIKVLLNK